MIKGVPCRPDMRIIPYTLLESPAAIQVAIMELISAILEGRIEYRKASLVMKGLQLAASLSKRVHFEMNPDKMVTELPNYAQQYLDEHPEHLASPPAQAEAPNPDPLPVPQSAINNQKSPMSSPQSPIGNRKSEISLNPRQQSQWKDIDRVERALAGALSGSLPDLKAVFTAAHLAPRKPR